MSDMWKAGTEVYKTMETLIANNVALSPLALVDDEILIVFKEKASKTGEHVIAGKTAKANALLAVVDGEKDWKFVITIAGDEWQSMGDKQREALLFHHLCACGVEENAETGKMKCYVKLPDVSFYREEVEEYGYWRTSGKTPEISDIEELFGVKPDPNATTKAAAPKTPAP
jgi:hypothetical protein